MDNLNAFAPDQFDIEGLKDISYHPLAEMFRGIYSPELDSMIDKINEMVVAINNLNQEFLGELEYLRTFYKMSREIDDYFEEIRKFGV